MLMATDFSTGVQLVGHGLGDFAGSASVQQMQQALIGLSRAAGWTAANPGPATGDVNPQTINALANVTDTLARKAGLPGKIATPLVFALSMATSSTRFMAAAKTAVASAASYLTPAVLALTAKYTKASAPPPPPPPPAVATSGYSTAAWSALPKSLFVTRPKAAFTRPLPAGAIQTRTKTGSYRVAVPAALATGLGGPSISLGEEFFELPSRPSPSPGAALVTESEFDKKTGEKPFYKKPLYWAILGGVVVAGGGAWWFMRG